MKLNFYKLFFVCFLFILLIILMFSFSLRSFTTRGIGDKNNDIWAACWYYWMTKNFVSSFPDLNFHTYNIFYPTGINYFLYIPFTFNNFLSLLFIFIFNPVTTHNLMIFLSVFLNCIGMYLLVHYLTKSPYAGLISGIIFGMHPYVLGQVFNGTIETVNMFWIPIYVLALIKLINEENIKCIFVTAICLSGATLFSWYYGIYLIIFSFLYFILRVFWKQRTNINYRRKIYFIYSVLLYSVFILPIIYPFLKNVVFTKPWEEIHNIQKTFIVDLLDFFKIGKVAISPLIRKFMKLTYIGYIPLLLSFFSFWEENRKKKLIIWSIIGFFFCILTLGNYFKFNGKVYFNVPLPSILFPLINTYRAFSIVILSLGILSGYGVDKVLSFLNNKKLKLFAIIIILVLVLSEFLILSPLPYPLPLTNMKIPDIYYKLKNEKGNYGIIEYPYNFDELSYSSKYMYYQTVHKKFLPIGDSYVRRGEFWDYLKQNKILKSLILNRTEYWKYSSKIMKEEINELAEDNFKYIIVHHIDLSEKESRRIDSFLKRFSTRIKSNSNEIILYKLK